VAETFLVVPEESLRGDAAKNLKIHQSLGLPLQVIRDFRELQLLKKRLPGVDLLIDGILGTGIRGPVTGFLGEVIGFITLLKNPYCPLTYLRAWMPIPVPAPVRW